MLIVQISDLHVAAADAPVRRFVDTNGNLACSSHISGFDTEVAKLDIAADHGDWSAAAGFLREDRPLPKGTGH